MRTLVLSLAAVFAGAGLVSGEIKTPQNVPIEITSTGETTYENGLATALDNVAIHIGNTDIYADYAQYNSTTHDVELRGHVRIYRDASLYVTDSGVYNTETKDPGNKWPHRVATLFSRGPDCELNFREWVSDTRRHFYHARFGEA